jgi:GxxExxY protein
MKELGNLYEEVRQTAYRIHLYLGHGHLEKVYENALSHRLITQGLTVEVQHPIKVYEEDGVLIGEYFADLWVQGVLMVELKATKSLTWEHEAQILGYLKATRMRHGLLINFGSYRFTARKFVWKPEGITES